MSKKSIQDVIKGGTIMIPLLMMNTGFNIIQIHFSNVLQLWQCVYADKLQRNY